MSGMPSPSPVRSNHGDRDKDSMWYFTTEELQNSPSRRNGISPDLELSYRQMTAYLIQEMGQRLQVSQLCINTAIVYMHRFYAFHSFTHFHRNGIATASLFLAAKVEEQPRKLEHVIKAANKCLNQPNTSTTDAYYIEQAQDLVFNENVLLQTLGFDVAIDHPHTHVVKTCHLVKACKDLAQTSYFLASNSLHLTSMCLQYKPTVVACFCIYLACKWSRWEIPQSTEGKHWFHYVDETVTMDLLKKLTDEFIAIYEKSPARLKAKLNSIKALAQGATNRQGQVKEKKADQDWQVADMMKMYQPADSSGSVTGGSGGGGGSSSQSSSSQYGGQGPSANDQQQQNVPPTMLPPPSHQPPQQVRKSEMHSSSSQHRSHHSSSSSSTSSSSHHPPKIGYSSGEVSDHKLGGNHKQQQQPPYGTNMVNRQREHSSSSSHSQSMMAPSSKSSSSSSSSRSSMANNMPSQSLSRPSSQGHSMDVNYHKSRDRSLQGPPGSHNMPPHGMPHKLPQKQQDSGRSLSKDHSGRMYSEQQNKQSSSSGNKAFSASSSSSSSSTQYGGNNPQLPPVSGSNQSSNKADAIHEIPRNMMHSSRGYNQPPPTAPTNGPPNNLLNFHQQQQQQGSRHSSSTNTNLSNNGSLKHEQSKQQQQISVHMQQPSQPSTHNHKPLMAQADAGYPGLTASQHDLQQQQQQQQQQSHAASLLGNNYCKIEPLQHSDDNSLSQFNSAHNQNTVTKTVSSMFSPDWNDKLMGHHEPQPSQAQQQTSKQQHQLPSNLNYSNNGGMTNSINTSEAYSGFKLTGLKESPPKIKTERDTPSKKDKSRTQQDPSLITGRSGSSSSTSNPNQPLLKTSLSNKLDGHVAGFNELAGTSNVGNAAGGGGVKRPNDQVTIKSEDDLISRDSKIRKLDSIGDTGKHNQVVNGIETNPDLVRNLLKESLCPPSALLKSESSIITPSLQPPAELFEPSATTSTQNPLHNTSAISASATNTLSGNSDVSAMETEEQGTSTSGSKSEKKKKKDKHKHKEKDKDKSKDREERKKHKKDKDRHRDKDRERESETAEHVKIKISKEKLESSGEPIGFKIKIPKDRIMGDISGPAATSHSSMETTHAPPVLKIKISKDKLESYSSGSASDILAGPPTQGYGHSSSQSSYAPYVSSHSSSATTHSSSSSSSSKKKDRDKDRERDKDKKRQHESSSKSNGGGGSSSLSMTAVGVTTNGSITGGTHSSSNSAAGGTTTQKSHYPSKF
ncbi:cyclin T isoform X2 [Haematobia irritans]|uniref:cyclin T isoform X2 n=1 Tax=Haematobia irritans TaxID=7368 RepID=UPI003F4FCDB5